MSTKNNKETNVLHEGYIPGLSVGAAVPPIYRTTTYNFTSAEAGEAAFKGALEHGDLSNLIYSRVNHPNAQIVEERICNLEPEGKIAAVFGSGMAAISTVLQSCCAPGKTIAYTSPLYGGTYQFLVDFLKPRGYKLLEINTNLKNAAAKIKRLGRNLGLLYIETPANPTLDMFDIEALTLIAKKTNPKCVTVLDNTFMGIFQQGFVISKYLDLIVYSGTKFLGGHSDVLCGVVISRQGKEELMQNIKGHRVIFGNILHPSESDQLTERIDTYEIRMKSMAQRATLIAEKLFLSKHPKLEKVLYPKLFKAGTDQYDLYHKQCSGASSIISLWLKTNKRGTFRFINHIKKSGVIQIAVSLGSVESLMSHPRTTTHSEMKPSVLDKLNITDNLVRFSVGLEDPRDLVKIILCALSHI